jgi:hypothetical protein
MTVEENRFLEIVFVILYKVSCQDILERTEVVRRQSLSESLA